MAQARLQRQGSPKGIMRFLYRAPIFLYRWHLGFLLGNRFVLVEHTGRKTGQLRRTVIEVVRKDDNTVYVAAAWGEKSDWLRNVEANPEVTYQLRSHRFVGLAEVVDETEARAALLDYSRRHPKTFDRLVSFMLQDAGETLEERVENMCRLVPIVRLRPDASRGIHQS